MKEKKQTCTEETMQLQMLKPPCGICRVTSFDQTTALLLHVFPNLRANWLVLLTEKTSPDIVNMVSLGLSL